MAAVAAGPTSIQSNAQPAGGTTATQPVPPIDAPSSIADLVDALTPAQVRFRQQSSPLAIDLGAQNFVNNVAQVRISSVGLGYRTVTWWHMVLTVANTGAGAQTVSLSPLFPYILIFRTSCQINGGATIFSASGVGSLVTAMRHRPGGLRLVTGLGGFGPALDPSLCKITVTGGTVTNTGAGVQSLSGIASISVAAAGTATITCDFYTFEKYALDRDSLLGALPLQNSATFAQLTYQLQSVLGATAATQNVPFYSIGANIAIAVSGASSVQSTYELWSVPPDPGLYADMIANSYQVQEQSGLSVAATGTDGLTYDIPRNMYLVAAHLVSFDANGVPIPYNSIDPLRLQYNAGTIRVVSMAAGRWRARQFMDYGFDLANLPGYRLWDGEATSETNLQSDNAGWLDAYNAANPQIVGSLIAGVAVPASYSIIREQVVAGAVTVI